MALKPLSVLNSTTFFPSFPIQDNSQGLWMSSEDEVSVLGYEAHNLLGSKVFVRKQQCLSFSRSE